MDEHQRRVGYANCDLGAEKLKSKEIEIEAAESFEDILAITEDVRKNNETSRLGSLWSYDTALRIGFYKKLFPKHVYLHAGARDGAVNVVGSLLAKKERLNKEAFPNDFQVMEPYEIEGYLCIYCK